MSSRHNEDITLGQNMVPSRLLTQEELESFREDYRELEKEIQNFFRVYYISGLILVAAWLTSSQSKPFLEILIGNGGYNVYAPIAIAALNMVSTTFLLYKGIMIHDIAQFMSFLSSSDSAYNYWENWRRNRRGAEYYARRFYAPLLVIVPLLLSGFILYSIYNVLYVDSQTLINRIQQSQPLPSAASLSSSQESTATEFHRESIQKIYEERKAFEEQKTHEERNAYIQRISPVLERAKAWFIVVSLLHIIPLFFIILSTVVTEKQWTRIRKMKGGEAQFKGLNGRSILFRLALINKRLKRKKGRSSSN